MNVLRVARTQIAIERYSWDEASAVVPGNMGRHVSSNGPGMGVIPFCALQFCAVV